MAWLKRQLKRSQTLVALKRRVLDPLLLIRDGRAIQLMEDLPAFVPNSSGPRRDLARLTLQSGRQVFPVISELLDYLGQEQRLQPIHVFTSSERAKTAAGKLKLLLDKHGSDKANRHDYHRLYGAILEDPTSAVEIMEIGLGTNNSDVVSSMGSSGVPGASLRAFKEYLPRARIYGADVDKRILFQEDRIKTFFVDQTDARTFAALEQAVGHSFDLVIDDGLHAPSANIATLLFALRNLKHNGWFVVEDISSAALPVWNVVTSLLSSRYGCWLISGKGGYLFILRNSIVPGGTGPG